MQSGEVRTSCCTNLIALSIYLRRSGMGKNEVMCCDVRLQTGVPGRTIAKRSRTSGWRIDSFEVTSIEEIVRLVKRNPVLHSVSERLEAGLGKIREIQPKKAS